MALVLFASAIVPRGYMVAPSDTGGVQITACPDTNPLARMAAHRQSEKHRLAHAAMGHDMDPVDGKAPSTSQAGGDCAFAGLSAHGMPAAAHVWDASFEVPALLAPRPTGERTEMRPLRLRPPLRGPPSHI